MKRAVIMLVVLFLFLPTVIATVTVTGPGSSQYNAGDVIVISGSVYSDNEMSGSLRLSLVCEETTYKLQPVPFNLLAKQQIDFSSLSLPTIQTSSTMRGLCHVNAEVLVGGEVLESDSSSNFEITNGLNGNFNLDYSQIQLGNSLTLSGTVKKMSGEIISGVAEVYFVQNGEAYLAGFSNVEKGKLSYTHKFTSGYSGDYTINLNVRDSYGNLQQFENVESFTVVNDLHVFVDTSVNSIYPGDHVNVYGNVKTVGNNYVTSGSVEIKMGDNVHSAELEDSQFTYDLFAPTNIKTGEQEVNIIVQDGSGNKGTATTTIKILPVPTVLEVSVNAEGYQPEETVEITSSLYDQANDLIMADVTVQLYDYYGNLVTEIEVNSGEIYKYKLGRLAVSGDWYAKVYYKNNNGVPMLIEKVYFNVAESKGLEHYIIGNTLYVTNVGNVDYTDDIEIAVEGEEGEEYIIRKSKNLDPNETIAIDLSQEVPSGDYSVTFPTGFAIAGQEYVNIANGKSRTSLNWMYTIIAILFVGGIGFVLYTRVAPRKKKDRKESKRTFFTGLTKANEEYKTIKPIKEQPLKKKKLVPANPEKKVNLTFSDKKQSIEDFKERTLKEIKRVQSMESKREDRNTLGGLGYLVGKSTPIKKEAPEQQEKSHSPFSLFD
jgi:hypothetical protein